VQVFPELARFVISRPVAAARCCHRPAGTTHVGVTRRPGEVLALITPFLDAHPAWAVTAAMADTAGHRRAPPR